MGLMTIITWVFGIGVVVVIGREVWKTFGMPAKKKDLKMLQKELRRKKVEAEISEEQAKINKNLSTGCSGGSGKKKGDFGSGAMFDYLLGGDDKGKPPKINI